MSGIQGYALSPRQRRLWELGQGDPAYDVRCRVRLAGADGEAVRRALAALVERHPALRTWFHRPAGSRLPVQVVAPAGAVDWAELDLAERPPAERAADAERAFGELAAPSADTEGAALGARWLRHGEREGELLLAVSALRADAASLRILVGELVALCAGEADAAAGDDDDGPLDFARVAEWQNELLAEAEEEETAFWHEQLDEAAWTAALPDARPAEECESYAPHHQPVPVDAELLDRLAGGCGAPPETVLLAAWYALVGGLAGCREPVVGVLFAGRDYEVLEEAVGPLEKWLPLRLVLDPAADLATLAGRAVALVERGGEVHEALRLEAPAGLPGDRRHLPFGFAWREHAVAAAGPVTATWERLRAVGERFDAQLVATRAAGVPAGTPAGAARLEIEYDPARYGAAEARLLGERLAALLARLADAPQRPLGAWELVAAAERARLLELAGGEALPEAANATLPGLFAAHAAARPDEVAVSAAGATLTYRRLQALSERLAARLAALGLAPEEPVGLATGRTPALAVGLLGILEAGGAYVPLDPNLPPARLATLWQASGARLAVVEKGLGGGADLAPDAVTVLLSADGELTGAGDAESPEVADAAGSAAARRPVRPEQLAYVLFTSGSTGVPKPVAVEHRQAVAYLRAITARLGLEPGLAYAMVSTLGADLGLTSLLPALFGGGRLLLYGHDEASDAAAFAARAGGEPADLLKIVPSHLRALLEAAGEGLALPRRWLVLGGEALSWDLVERLREAGGAGRLVNHYGPTEATVGALAFVLPADGAVAGSRTVPLGTPLAGERVHLLDARGRLAPLGATGEIALGGAGVARGYAGRPAATAERFLPDPFSGTPGARLYRTGDLGRLLPGGEVEFLGRADGQVKIRGFRVEPGEVEAVLGKLPAVRAAAVAARPDGRGGQRLVAWVVPAGGWDPAALREALGERLPDAWVPAAWVAVERLPLSANGKLDRAALPDPEDAPRHDFAPPEGPVEEAVCRVWRDLLGSERIGRGDNFFELGGHSLLAMQVVARLREVFQVPFTLGTLFDSPTVRGLAAALTERESSPGRTDVTARVYLRVRDLAPEEAERLVAAARERAG